MLLLSGWARIFSELTVWVKIPLSSLCFGNNHAQLMVFSTPGWSKSGSSANKTHGEFKETGECALVLSNSSVHFKRDVDNRLDSYVLATLLSSLDAKPQPLYLKKHNQMDVLSAFC